jgi:hypothetical protein
MATSGRHLWSPREVRRWPASVVSDRIASYRPGEAPVGAAMPDAGYAAYRQRLVVSATRLWAMTALGIGWLDERAPGAPVELGFRTAYATNWGCSRDAEPGLGWCLHVGVSPYARMRTSSWAASRSTDRWAIARSATVAGATHWMLRNAHSIRAWCGASGTGCTLSLRCLNHAARVLPYSPCGTLWCVQMEEEGVPSTALREISLLQMLSESIYIVRLLKVEHVEENGKPILYLVRTPASIPCRYATCPSNATLTLRLHREVLHRPWLQLS